MSPVKFSITMDNGVFLCVCVFVLLFYYNGIHNGDGAVLFRAFMTCSAKMEYPLGFSFFRVYDRKLSMFDMRKTNCFFLTFWF